MEISELGEFGFIDHLTKETKLQQSSTLMGVGDDAAVIDMGEEYTLLTTDMVVEGIDFDLTYTPLKHLGYKCVVVAASDICAMNGTATQLTVSLALSARYTVEMVSELYEGIKAACKEYKIDLVGGDTTASLTGFMISLSCLGKVSKEKIAFRSGAKPNDLLCVSGDLGASYIGLKLLEREKKVLRGNTTTAPEFGNYKYQLAKYLRPALRSDIIELLNQNNITPTSMIDISDGCASEVIHLCNKSGVGAKIYTDFLPYEKNLAAAADELGEDVLIAAMNGGGDYELLFTVSLSDHEKIKELGDIRIIGHIAEKSEGVKLVTPQQTELTIKAQGHK